jgi:hypothetical protein
MVYQVVERNRTGFNLSKDSIAHRVERAGETYDASESSMREQIVVANSYNLFLRHQPSQGWFRKYSNEYLKGNGRGICEKCKFLDLFYCFIISLIISTGLDCFIDDDLVVATFYLQRIPGIILTPTDVDNSKLTFDVHVSHAGCITPRGWIRFVVPSSDGFEFHDNIYFHPNVRTDGWELIRWFHESAKGKHARDLEAEKEKKGKEKGKGKGKGKGKSKDKGGVYPNLTFPSFPLEPHFWVHSVIGSAIGLWPPRLFNEWVTLAQQGVILTLDPVPTNLAGPSNSHSKPPSSSSSSSSTLSMEHSPSFSASSITYSQKPTQALPSPPYNPNGPEEDHHSCEGSPEL